MWTDAGSCCPSCAYGDVARLCPHPSTAGAAFLNPRSLRTEYDQYVELEIENYKDSISRTSLLKIGDEAVATLCAQTQITLTEMVIWQEVDRIITRRLRLPTYQTWRRRRLKQLALFGRPDYWGLDPSAAFIRELQDFPDRHVLVAGADGEGPALYLAARGCAVTTLSAVPSQVERVLAAAHQAGLTSRVRGYCSDLAGWTPDHELHAVVCASDLIGRLDPHGRTNTLRMLQDATARGGLHLVQGGLAPGSTDADAAIDGQAFDDLASCYEGWRISVDRDGPAGSGAFVARKEAVA